MAKTNKSWFKSKTIQGAIVSIIGLIVLTLDLPVGSGEINDIVAQVAIVFGSLASVYGRIVTDGSKITK